MSLPYLPSISLWSSLAVGSLGCMAYITLSFYYKVHNLPKGPIPLPLVGNLFNFMSSRHVHEVMHEMSNKYSAVFTIYLSHKPIVIIADPRIANDEMRKAAFAGRPEYGINKIMFGEDSTDVFFGDYSREWEVLKSMAHTAIKKYTASERHPVLVARVVDRLFDRIDNETGRRQGIEPENDFPLMMNAILSSAAFGKEYEFEDPEFLSWKSAMDRQFVGRGKLTLMLFVPILKYVFPSVWNNFQEANAFQRSFVKDRFVESNESFDGTTVSNFCQAVISAKKEAEAEDKETAKYMTEKNLTNVIFDLFFAGADTTKNTLCWLFLLSCKHPILQIQMMDEVAKVVGSEDQIPKPEHKDSCPHVMAFISECMRFRSIIPNGVPHKTTVETELDGHLIPKGTIVLHPNYKTFMEADIWTDPLNFRPDRFIGSDGQFSTKDFPFFKPFGVGRRSCPGNKLASLTMFLVVARFLQRVRGICGNSVLGIKGGNESVGVTGQKVASAWVADKYVMEIQTL